MGSSMLKIPTATLPQELVLGQPRDVFFVVPPQTQ
jgi:hypothetical protein